MPAPPAAHKTAAGECDSVSQRPRKCHHADLVSIRIVLHPKQVGAPGWAAAAASRRTEGWWWLLRAGCWHPCRYHQEHHRRCRCQLASHRAAACCAAHALATEQPHGCRRAGSESLRTEKRDKTPGVSCEQSARVNQQEYLCCTCNGRDVWCDCGASPSLDSRGPRTSIQSFYAAFLNIYITIHAARHTAHIIKCTCILTRESHACLLSTRHAGEARNTSR